MANSTPWLCRIGLHAWSELESGKRLCRRDGCESAERWVEDGDESFGGSASGAWAVPEETGEWQAITLADLGLERDGEG